MKRFLFFVLIIAVFLGSLYEWTQRRRQSREAPYTPASAPVVDAKDVHLLSEIDQEYTGVVDAVLPSVVSITTSKQVQTGIIIDLNEALRSGQLRGVPKLENKSVLGSGVIVSKEGHILTNYHVIADTDKIQVELSDGRAMPAQIIGTDPETDIAVLKIQGDKLRPLPIGNSDDVKVGQLVFAVGNPLGLQETVTRGIISAKSRVVDDSSLEYFQTDAAINEGNSGGPLVNLRGEVIGINTRIASQAGNHLQPQGLSFAIPSNVAQRTLEAIIKEGRVVHSYLGVVFKQLPPELAAETGVNQAGGVVVNGILAGSPAEKAGLRNGDIIAKYNGREIAGIHDLHNRVAETPVNSSVTLDVIRANGKHATLTAQIVAQPTDFNPLQPVPSPATPQGTTAASMLAGVKVTEIPADQRAILPAGVKGVAVVEIDPASFMGKFSGTLKPGDVIEEIDHLPVASLADFELVARRLPPDAQQMLFLIFRDGASSYVVVTRR